jgi:hypothetical protein
MTHAVEFFKNEIKDNNFDGIKLSNNIDITKDSLCSTNRKQNKEDHRKNFIFKFITNLSTEIATKNIEDLITQITFDEEFDANTKQKIFELSGYNFEDLAIYTSNIVGSINFQGKQFNINSRFGNKFLEYMIASSSGFLELENLGTIDKNVGLGEWLLIYYWKIQLKKAFAFGMYKSYQEKTDNISTLRGRLNTQSYIKKSYFDGKIECSFKEHSYNNIINITISQALKRVFKKEQYRNIVQDIYEIKNAFDTIEVKRNNLLLPSNQKVLNPFYVKYNEVYRLSLAILNNNFASIGDNSEEFSAFLFDISLLFEHHIRKILQQKFKLFEKNKKEFTLPNGVYENNIYPDIIIDHGDGKISIFDVKYKHFNRIHGVDREDRFQLTSYVSTHLSKYDVIECGFIYPSTDKQKLGTQILKVCKEEIVFNIYLYPITEDDENFINLQRKNDIDFLNYFKELQNDPI